MSKYYTVYEVQAQSMFCKELMSRLDNDIQKARTTQYSGAIEGHTMIRNDVIRLRRELNQLRTMLDPWGR